MKYSMYKFTKLTGIISLMLGVGAVGVCQGSFKLASSNGASVKETPTTDEKGGSFKYLAPAGNASDKCPGPYESMAITFINDTTHWTSKRGTALAYNIYYIVDDSRGYKGDYAYPEYDQNTFPTERKGVSDAEGTYTPSSATSTGSDTSGPIQSVYTYGALANNQLPIRSWPRADNFRRWDWYDLYKRFYATAPGDVLHVMTVYKNINGFMDYSTGTGNVQAGYLDKLNDSDPSTFTVRLPVRSYKLLAIEPMATSTSDISKKNIQPGNWAFNAEVDKITTMSNITPFRIHAVPVSSQSGNMVNFYSAMYSHGKIPSAPSQDSDYSNGSLTGLATFPQVTSVNLRTVDEIRINVSGEDNILTSSPLYTGSGSANYEESEFFKGTDMTIKYLKDKATNKTIVCD